MGCVGQLVIKENDDDDDDDHGLQAACLQVAVKPGGMLPLLSARHIHHSFIH